MHQNVRWTLFALIITVLISTIIIIIIVNIQTNYALPCNYVDSIDITDGTLQSDSSILFHRSIFPKDQYYKVSSYSTRGCVCNTKPCIRLCCPLGVFYDNNQFKCHNQTHELANRFEQEVLDIHNQTERWTLEHHFAFVYEKPCSRMFIADDHYYLTHVRDFGKYYVYLFETRTFT